MLSVELLRSELSSPETEIWALQRRMNGSACCWVAECLEILGPIDPGAFRAALHEVIESIPALHASFEEHANVPRRTPRPARPWHLPIEDFASEADPASAAEIRMKDLVTLASGLDADPLFRFALFRLGPARWMWLQSYHHIVMDAAGFQQVAALLADRYSAKLAANSDLPTLPLHTLPAMDPMSRDRVAEAECYWRALLRDWHSPLRLGGREALPAPLSLSVPIRLSRVVAKRLERAGCAAGHRLAHVMMAAAALWLNATSGRTDVVFGLAVRDRGRASETPHATPGPAMLTNVVPVRVTISRDANLVALAGHIARQRRAARAHDGLRGTRILRLASQPTAQSFGPAVNIMLMDYGFTFGGYPCKARNISIGPLDDVCLCIYDRKDGQGLTLRLNGNPALYSEAALAAHARRLAKLLVQLARAPGRPASTLDPLDAGERRLLLDTWNDTARPVAAVGFAGMVLDQSCSRPWAPFLRYRHLTISYRAAVDAARSLAEVLRQRGIGPGAIVAILLPRSPEYFVSVLGIALSGAALAPIDLANPAARIEAMLEDSRAACVVTTASVMPVLAFAPGLKVVEIDTVREADPAGQETCTPPRSPPFRPDDIAYVIFTSGTTGRPKAVAVPQRGLASLAAFQADHLRLEPHSRILQFASVGFDAVLMELLMAVAVGACLFLPNEEQRHGADLGAYLTQNAITHALLPPAMLHGLDAATQAYPSTLVVGGEACSRSLAGSWSVGRRMVNAYGPTEATICATMSEPLAGDEEPPIGRPIWNTRVYVLDEFGRPLPAGNEGELYIAGAGVADGYIGRPEASDLRFIPCPFAPGGIMVRTGDRVRFDTDGTLTWLGRADRQLKLRGIRIEPAEIEAALCRVPGVLQAVVIAEGEGDSPTRSRLVAYVVHQAGTAARPDKVRAAAAAYLPLAMLPAVVVVLDELPLTWQRKIDLRALPPVCPAAEADPLGLPPATVGGRRLAALFAEVLNREQVGMDDDFFALGGDSLSATQLVHRVNEVMGSNLTLADVFEQPRLDGLMRRVADRGAPQASPFATMLGFRIDSSKPALFCVHTGSGIGWAYSALLQHLNPAQPLYAIQARGLDGLEALPESLDAMSDDYADEIRRVQPTGPYHLLGWSSGGPLAHRVACRLQSLGSVVGLLASLDGYPAGSMYAAGVPPPHAFSAAQADLRKAIELYLAADSSHGMAREDVIDDDVLARMIRVHVNTGSLLATGRTGSFNGNILLFTCSEPYRPEPMPPPSAWAPHVTGAVDVVEVPGHHDMMLMPAPAAVIGRVVAAKLAQWGTR